MQDNGTRRMGRREALALIGATGAALGRRRAPANRRRARRAQQPTTDDDSHDAQPAADRTGAACAVTPNETVGPYPSLIDLFRSDIREGKSGTQLT